MRKKFIISLMIILIGGWLTSLYGPWWSSSVFIIMVVALLDLPKKMAMLTSTIGLAVIFIKMAIWMHMQDHADIIGKTGALLGGLSPIHMILVTTLIGAITGFFSGWLGSAIGSMLRNKN
jgi:NAD/NADP transhydrogenase beta subunit